MTPSRWQQTEELYHAALGCEQGEREALLARADPELRREVESLLAQQSGATPLDRPAWEGAASLFGSTVAALTPGTQLGPYKIEGPLAAGGMGEVFRGVDTRLGRPVAVKTSLQQFSARFEREARVISSLNHPHICTLYDVGPNYLVMELCEGETLATRLKRGKLSIKEAGRYGAQIADALAAAHAKGITHRDLKPGNIMLSKAGIKVLDFGLAKSPQDLTLTGSRMVMGTPAYMAPEQREGKECDARTDIYSLGLVLYEMVTGKLADQAMTSMKGHLPEKLAHVIERCLAPEPDDRWQSARDLERELEWAATSKRLPDIGDAAYLLEDAPTANSRSQPEWLSWGAAAFFFIASAALALVHFREAAPQERHLRVQVALPSKVPTAEQRISPDGRYLVFAGPHDNDQQLWLRPLNSVAVQPLAGTEGAVSPFWSPDSKSIGFFAGGRLKRIEVTGGPVHTLADAQPGGGAWGPADGNSGGVILFVAQMGGPILRIPAEGGTVSPVTNIRLSEISHRFPWFLPDGRHFLYSAVHEINSDQSTIHVGDLSSAQDRVIGDADSEALYSQGLLLFSREETLVAQPFDAQRGVATGDAVPLEQQIQRRAYSGYADFSVSANGLLAFHTGAAGDNLQLTWVDRGGKQLGPLGEPGKIDNFQFSPDGKSVVAGLYPSSTRNNGDIWIYNAASGLRTRFTFDAANDMNPVFSPDGLSIVFASRRKQHIDLYRKSSDGTGAEELLYSDNLEKYPTSWSPDGKFLLYRGIPGTGVGRVWVLPLTPERQGAPLEPFTFAPSAFSEGNAQFSPDGRWIAYSSLASQRSEVYVARFPGAGGKRQISIAGGLTPRWQRDGKEMFYMAPDGTVMSAAVTIKGDVLEVGEIQPLFGPVAVTGTSFRYDVAPDGQRFLIVPPPQTLGESVTVVQNWQAGLKNWR